MSDWVNPYESLQREIRGCLRETLKRNNGIVVTDEIMGCLNTNNRTKAQKLFQRLFKPSDDGTFEWKPEIVSEEMLVKKLDGNQSVNAGKLASVFRLSRSLGKRTAHPYVAPSNNRSQLVPLHSFAAAPVFGVDVLVRPPTEFTNVVSGDTLKNDFNVGEQNFALFLHGTFEDGLLVDDGEFFARLVVGDAFKTLNVAEVISRTAGQCEADARLPLVTGDVERAVERVAKRMNSFAFEVYGASL